MNKVNLSQQTTEQIEKPDVNTQRGDFTSASPSCLFPNINTPIDSSEESLMHTPLLSSVNQNKNTSGENNMGGSPDDNVINRNNDTSGNINLFESPGDSVVISTIIQVERIT